jgi:quercetin 2,3-dioxygenase
VLGEVAPAQTGAQQQAIADHSVHFLQIWLIPTKQGIAPSYEQKTFAPADRRGRLRLLASPDGRDASLTIHSDALINGSVLAAGESVPLALASDRHAWVQVARGRVHVNGRELAAGDGAALSEEPAVRLEGIAGESDAELLVFDLA